MSLPLTNMQNIRLRNPTITQLHTMSLPYQSPCDAGNALSPVFAATMQQIQASYFSRNPEIWPIFKDPGIQAIGAFRSKHIEMDSVIDAYPNGEQRLEELNRLKEIPDQMTPPTSEVNPLLLFATTTSKNWEDPASVENVICLPSDPAIYGSIMGTVANPNLVYEEYCGMSEQMERSVVRQMASLAGYDPELATGVFTQGGTFCNMYGYLFGLRKSLPESIHTGLEGSHDYRIINSQGGHYSNTTNLSVLGVDIKNKTIRIQLTADNNMDMVDLEEQLTACFRLNCVVPTIMLTMGTTDTFGVDRVKPVHDLLTRLCDHFDIGVRPHIHVDAAVGWPLIFFRDYDFENNPLAINPTTLKGLERHAQSFRELHYADSFTIDFQKWGFVPYTSSLIMVKNNADMKALEHDPENFSYFENDVQGKTHLQSTIECSRSASGMFGAYTGLQYLGKEGYQALIAHGLQNANYFRQRLSQIPGVYIVAAENQGPSVGFRMYDPSIIKDVEAEYLAEKAYQNTPEYIERVGNNTSYHRNIFLNRQDRKLYTNWVEFIAHSDYDKKGRWSKIPGEKAVFMNPMTSREQIDAFIETLSS